MSKYITIIHSLLITPILIVLLIHHYYPLNKSGRITSSGTSLRHLSLVTERFTPDY